MENNRQTTTKAEKLVNSTNFLTYNKFSYFSLSPLCRIDERRLSGAASNNTILNIQFALKTFISYFLDKIKIVSIIKKSLKLN